jgi:hypothetical protein
MRIKLVYGNHIRNGRIPECTFLLKHALEEMGWQADFEERIVPGTTNVMVEGFSDECVERIRAAAKANTRLYIICTEYLTGETFNSFDVVTAGADKTHYGDNDYWKIRYQRLLSLTPYITGLFHLAMDQVEVYQNAFSDIPVRYLPHGYIPSMESVNPRIAYRDIDVVFTGTLTPYRQKILDALRDHSLRVKHLSTDTPAYLRDDFVARSKVAVQLRQNDSWRFTSNSRQHYHLTNRSCLVGESSEVKTDLCRFLPEYPADKLVDRIVEVIENQSYDALALTAYQRFSTEMRMTRFMPEILAFLRGGEV